MFTDTTCDATKELASLTDVIPAGTISILEKFNDGHQTGYNWPDAWGKTCPGGPWIFSCGSSHWHRNKCEWCDKAAQSRAEHAAWIKGWMLGHAKKLTEGRKNPVPTSEEIRAFNEGKRKSNLYR